MKLEELKEEVKRDLIINKNDLIGAAADNALIHHKYLCIYTDLRLQYKKELIDFNRIKKNSYRYWMGYERECPPEVLDARGVKYHMEGDDKVLDSQKRLFVLEEKIKFLEETISSIVSRGFNIKNIIEVKKFEMGA